MILPITLLTFSCAKEVVESRPEQTPQPVLQAEGNAAEESLQAGRGQAEGLRAEAAAREAAENAFVDETIQFDFDSSALSLQARQILNTKADFLRTNPGVTVTVEGHCDDRGTDAYNMALGERRAESVKKYLLYQGIGADRLDTISYGEERPLTMGENETCWSKNRRAQFVLN